MMFALVAASTEICIDMFLSGAVAGLTLVTTGSKVKKAIKKRG
jgi:hypothetical protein